MRLSLSFTVDISRIISTVVGDGAAGTRQTKIGPEEKNIAYTSSRPGHAEMQEMGEKNGANIKLVVVAFENFCDSRLNIRILPLNNPITIYIY